MTVAAIQPDPEVIRRARARVAAARSIQKDRKADADERRNEEYQAADREFVKVVEQERSAGVEMTDLADAAGISRQMLHRLVQ